VNQRAHEIQPYGRIVKLPIALSETVWKESVENLNQLLADTIILRHLYKKHHQQVIGEVYQLHLPFDKHYDQPDTLVHAVAERIQLVGGFSLAMAHDTQPRRQPSFPVHRRAARRCRCRFHGCSTRTRLF
jgi:starvation-inducible DNA-binding protein